MSVSSPSCSPFTRAVVSSMRKLYPESLADKSFDNTGLLLEAPFDPARRQRNSVLLTIDLTTAVADEAIRRWDSMVIAYHPIIFRGLKAITLNDTQQRSLLRLAQHGISVYSPHTAVDTVPGGMADWLCDVVAGAYRREANSQKPAISPSSSIPYSAPVYPQFKTAPACKSTPLPHTRTTIHPSPPTSIPEGFESAGAGRLLTFTNPQPLPELLNHITHGIGYPGGIQIAIPQWASLNDIRIKTVGTCPGSGSSVLLLRNGSEIPDMLLTGEISHHETLSATERGAVVVALGHSNSERGFLHAVMRQQLKDELVARWQKDREDADIATTESAKQGGAAPASGFGDVFADHEVEVGVSAVDRDPFGVMIWRG